MASSPSMQHLVHLTDASPNLLELAKKTVEEYDFIRLTFADMNGVPRGVILPGDEAGRFLQTGYGCFAGLQIFGPQSQMTFPQEIKDCYFGSVKIIPDLTTLHPLPWAGYGKYKTGQLLAETYWETSKPQEASTRSVARKMLNELDAMGLRLMSGIELEYVLIDNETQKPVFSGNGYMSQLAHSEFDSWMCDVQKSIKETGISSVECMHIEYAPGQFEFTTVPRYGINGADASFVLKQGVKDMAIQRGWFANFMARHHHDHIGSGTHFNFSVFHKGSGRNAFYDESAENNISEFGHYWIGGLVRHAKALTALCCITTNCFQRLHQPWIPNYANWGIQDRHAMIRVKNDGEKGTYFENRIPSALSNPYLVMAGTIAAGMDGVKNKMECPEPHDSSESVDLLPATLEEALECLQRDEVMVEAIGESFVKWFVRAKKEIDLAALKGIEDKSKRLEMEKAQYCRFM